MISFKAKLKLKFLDGAIAQRLDPVTRKFLAWTGLDLMRAGRKQLRPAKQKKISELTEDELERYRTKQRLFAQGVLNVKPRRPDASAKKGEPARTHYRPNPLRDGRPGILFSLNEHNDAVVAGPKSFGDNAAESIEKHNPFMAPALDKVRPKIPKNLQRAAG